MAYYNSGNSWYEYPYASSSGSSTAADYNIVTPTSAAVGSRVGQVSTPNPYADLSSVFPGLGTTNANVSSSLNSMLQGQLSPDTLGQIQNYAASRGISGGMPGSNLYQNLGARSVGLSSEQLQQQGLQDYSSIIPTISSTQTVSPSLQYQINEQNATNAASPDPVAASTFSQNVFKNYLSAMTSPSSGTGGYGYNISMPNTASSSPSSGTGGYSYGSGYSGMGGYSSARGSSTSPYQVFSMGSFPQTGTNSYTDMTSAGWSPDLGQNINASAANPQYDTSQDYWMGGGDWSGGY